MKRILFFLVLCLIFSGCEAPGPAETVMASQPAEVIQTTVPTVPPTVPQDGDPKDVTCLGSYTHAGQIRAVAAELEGAALTNEELSVWYWAEVSQYRMAGHPTAPDFDKPLDTQVCTLDSSVNSWQQYFLRCALDRWHTAAALKLQGDAEGLPVEEAHNPDPHKYETYLVDIPATRYLYRYQTAYTPNSMHQAYLDSLPQRLDALAQERGYADGDALAKILGVSQEALVAWAEDYNRGYLYFTNLTYFLEPAPDQEATPAGEEKTVDIRQILVTREHGSEDLLKRIDNWKEPWSITEGQFADLARHNSQDAGSYTNGGAYRGLEKGQLRPELESWCFDQDRKPGDTTCIQTEQGYHLLYFCGSQPLTQVQAEKERREAAQAALLSAAREKYPMTVHYSALSLTEGKAAVSYEDILYPDVAHERFPEVPLYLQADYLGTKYGQYALNTHGCGITSLAMLSSYMTDQELTPAVLAKRYGRYCFSNGTDSIIFVNEPPVLGFYLKEKTFDHNTAKRALEEGYIVVVSQNKGYWTRTAHFLVLEKMDENDMVTVRDSNIFNYQKIPGFKQDCHPWSTLVSGGKAFWVFEKKEPAIPACRRCGEGLTQGTLLTDYTCERCTPALMRRGSYLAG